MPKDWLEEHPNIFFRSDLYHAESEETHTVTVVQPTALEEVIFEALSENAYAASVSQGSSLESWFSQRRMILHQGSVYSLNLDGDATTDFGDAGNYRFRLVMASPVLQGYIKEGYTRLFITGSSYLQRPQPLPDSNGLAGPVIDMQDSDRDSIEIAEDFLANSTLPSMLNTSSTEVNGRTNVWSANGHAETEQSQGTQIPLAEWTCAPRSLRRRVSKHDDDCTIYVRTSDLRRIGVLNGDWVSRDIGNGSAPANALKAVASSRTGSSYRLVRIHSKDDVTPES